jgi:hypothetical protein
VVVYTGRFPILGLAANNALITAQKAREGGGTGFVENLFSNLKLHTVQAANQEANALLGHYGQDATLLEFTTRTTGLTEGQLLTVRLSDFALSNAQMLITSVEISDTIGAGYNIWFYIQAVGSPLENAQWQTYWQNLQNQTADPSDLTDVQAADLAFLYDSFITLAPTTVVTKTVAACPICGPSTFCGPSLFVC